MADKSCAKSNSSEAPSQCEPQYALHKGEIGFNMDDHRAIAGNTTILSYDEVCQWACKAELIDCECGCHDYIDYLCSPVLSPCESVIKGFSPGPARDHRILQILRAGHRPDFDNYVRVHQPDLLKQHEWATEIIREYREGMAIVEKIQANAIIYQELLRKDPEEHMRDVDEDIVSV
ncbi:hypothetical protein BT96DRAFT_1004244 [Gymnopus androsaceus JB14]|uniref:Uncharacterized protein n=1 Tax=Gymnopus androsaceus JB14 TaxID=1447944 RepID=A0A6A4GT90_9AGAR|nr:hypothetical protein BT96DRAFT_1004244 [Gymnopus androsaceus JB14]